MKKLQVAHCDACGREIMIRNIKPQDVVREDERGVIIECISCGHHQFVSYEKEES